jgi:beta-N-acetylhexosaminidase
MVGHLRNAPAWGGVASQEGYAIKKMLRKQLKFDGVTISDDLGMGAVSARTGASVRTAVTSAIKTGIDIVLIAHPIADDTGQFVNSSIIEAVDSGTLSRNEINKSLRRIAKLKRKLPTFQKSPALASREAMD